MWLSEKEAEVEETSKDGMGKLRVVLGAPAVLRCLEAWDVHRTDQTYELAVEAVAHANKEPQPTYEIALSIAKNRDMAFSAALNIANAAMRERLPGDQSDWPWLYDPTAHRPTTLEVLEHQLKTRSN